MGDALWAWKSFLRGHNPILMDYGIIDVVDPLDSSLGVPSYESLEPARHAMGDTLRFARRLNLSAMPPRDDLSSTGYVLAEPGQEYLVLQPSPSPGPFTAALEGGVYTVEWFCVDRRESVATGEVRVVGAGPTGFSAPFETAGPVVLYLKRAVRRDHDASSQGT
jgi:hypothetical protein